MEEQENHSSFLQKTVRYFTADKRSILAGVLIAIGGIGFLSCTDKAIGAFLFSCGLISVIVFQSSLYTGKVGYFAKWSDFPRLLLMCIKNMIGAAAVGLMAQPLVGEAAKAVAEKKLSAALPTVFIKSVLCGFMIYIAVELYKKTKSLFAVVLPIMLFILAGFEHCIANAFYFAAAGRLDGKVLLFLAVGIIGNGVGSVLLHFLRHVRFGIIPEN